MGVTVREKIGGSGEYWIFIAHEGKRRSKKIGDRRKAKQISKEIERRLASNEFRMEKAPTLEEYSKKWLEGYSRNVNKESTYESNRALLVNHILPEFGSRRIDQIKRGEFKDFLLKKMESHSVSTVKNIKACLSSIFNYARDDELLNANPLSRLRIFPKQDIKRGVDRLTAGELTLFLETAEKHFPGYYPFFLLLSKTGMRLGETIALRWTDIDFNSHLIHVRQNIVRGRVTTPKSKQVRKVDISDHLEEVLKLLKHQRKEEKLKYGWQEIPEPVFFNGNLKPYDINNLRKRIFFRVLDKAGLRRIRIHDLRHTYASILLENGASPVYVKEQLGHHSIKITVDLYGHFIPGANRDSVNKLDQLTCTQLHPIRTQAQKKGHVDNVTP